MRQNFAFIDIKCLLGEELEAEIQKSMRQTCGKNLRDYFWILVGKSFIAGNNLIVTIYFLQ